MSKAFEEEGRQSARMSRPAEGDDEMYGSGNVPDPYDDAEFHRTKRAERAQEGKQRSAARSGRSKGNNVEFTQMTGDHPSLRPSPLRPDRERTLVSRVSQRGGSKHPEGVPSRRDSRAPSHKEYGSVAQETGYMGKYNGPAVSRLSQADKHEYASDDGGSLCSEDERDLKMLNRKRAARERRNLSVGELYYRLDHAETDEEQQALGKEIERRRRVSKIVGFFGGHTGSEKTTRAMLVAGGWSRK